MGLFNFFNKKPSLSVIELQNDLRILNDCASLIEKTVNPDVFFSRFDLYYEKLSILADAQKRKIVVVKGDNIAKKYSKLNTPTAKADKINTFIKRYWDSTCSKSQKLKTEKGKNNCFENFKSSLSNYDSRLPDSCIEYYNYLYTSAPRTASMPRNQIPAKQINSMQQFKASDTYCQTIYDLYYKDYSEKPFISQDREFNTNWIEQSKMFPNQSLVSEAMMKRYPDGLLPGHIYMLYWLKKYTNKRVPSYFEYKYGIDFYKEKEFLTQNGYLENSKPTHKGELAINTHQGLIAAIAIIVIGICVWYFQVKKPHDLAETKFNAAVKEVEAKNTELTSAMNDAQKILDKKEAVYDNTTKEAFITTLSDAKAAQREIPDLPKKTADINA